MKNVNPMRDCVRKILDERALEFVLDDGENVRLKDRQSGMVVQITETEKLCTAIQLDAIGHLPGLKQGMKLDKKCDYFLFVQADGNYHVILVELKKTYKVDDGDTKEQLRCSRPILDYLLSAYGVHCGLKPKISAKYAVIAEKFQDRLDKQPIRMAPGEVVRRETYRQIGISTFAAPKIGLEMLLAG